jgi:competence protein ComEA
MPPQTETGGGTGPGAVSIVDVNSATEVELEALPGIGPALASAIVEWRARNGPFSTPDDLLDVPGIGPAKLDGLVDHIVL